MAKYADALFREHHRVGGAWALSSLPMESRAEPVNRRTGWDRTNDRSGMVRSPLAFVTVPVANVALSRSGSGV